MNNSIEINDYPILILKRESDGSKLFDSTIAVSDILPFLNLEIPILDIYENQLKQIERDSVEYLDFQTVNELPTDSFPFISAGSIFDINDVVTVSFIKKATAQFTPELKINYLNSILLSCKDFYQLEDEEYLQFVCIKEIAEDYIAGYNRNISEYLYLWEKVIQEAIEGAEELPVSLFLEYDKGVEKKVISKNFRTIFEFLHFPFMLDGTVSLSRLIELYVFYSINTVKVMNYCGEQLSILHHTQYHSESILFNSEKNQEVAYDVFVSHASEDKEDFVRDFVKCLQQHGLKVWYDEFTLRVGDSLRRSIDNGLKNSRYGIVVLSEAFFSKEWPQRELDGLFAREVNGEKVILPIWHKISKNEVLKFSPIIADMLALNTSSFTIEEIAKEISDRVLN